MNLSEALRKATKVEIANDTVTLEKYSRDTSIFSRTPKIVAFPRDASDVSLLTKFVHNARSHGDDVTLTGRSAGTDMTGGVLTDSISVVFTKYMNRMGEISSDYAVAEPGVYYRDFEKATREKNGTIYPAYPASRELCAIGGIVSNNSGGELNLKYGKTNKHVKELELVLSDGSQVTTRPLNLEELKHKEKEDSFEGKIYRELHKLIVENKEEIEKARPN